MSPLIDCVFLLLIFFLVTTMLKRKEKLIKVDLPDSTASVAAVTHEEDLVIGLDAAGGLLVPAATKNRDGSFLWEPIPNLAAYLQEQVARAGAGLLDRPLQINADRDTPFEEAVRALDVCKLQGFHRVSIKTRQPFIEDRGR